MLDKRQLIEALRALKERYEHYRNGTLREALTRYTLIDPLLISLGWDISDPGQCLVEDVVPTADRQKWADYSLLNPDGTVRLVWEAKRADISFSLREPDDHLEVWSDQATKKHVEQALQYSYNKGAEWAVLTNGHQLVLLESFRRGQEHLRFSQARMVFQSLDDMLVRSEDLWLLNRSSVLSGNLDREFGLEPRPIVISQPLPAELTAPDIYSDRSGWLETPVVDIPDYGAVLIEEEAEQICTNLFPLVTVPDHIYSAPTTFRRKKDILRRVGSQGLIPCILKQKRLWSFADLSKTDYPKLGICTPQITKVEVSTWMGEENTRRWLIELLGDCLHEYIYQSDLKLTEHRDRYYFLPFTRDIIPRWVRYRAFSNRVRRWVVWQDRESGYWMHRAVNLRFLFLGDEIFLLIDPTIQVTVDGQERAPGPVSGPMVTSHLSGMRNKKFLYEVNFWKAWLAQELRELTELIVLPCGNTSVEISTQPLSGIAPFSVPFDTEEDSEEETDDIDDPDAEVGY